MPVEPADQLDAIKVKLEEIIMAFKTADPNDAATITAARSQLLTLIAELTTEVEALS